MYIFSRRANTIAGLHLSRKKESNTHSMAGAEGWDGWEAGSEEDTCV